MNEARRVKKFSRKKGQNKEEFKAQRLETNQGQNRSIMEEKPISQPGGMPTKPLDQENVGPLWLILIEKHKLSLPACIHA